MRVEWNTLSWDGSRLGLALVALAQASGLPHRQVEVMAPPAELAPEDGDGWSTWIEDAADLLGLEAELVGAPYPEVEWMLRGAAPALLRVPGPGAPEFLLLLKGGRRVAHLLTPDLRRVRVSARELHGVICRELEATKEQDVRQMVAAAGGSPREQARTYAALMREQLGPRRIAGCWMLRLPPGASFQVQLGQRRLGGWLLGLIAAHLAAYGVWLLSWWLVGQGALSGHLDRGRMMAWGLLLLTLVPLRAASAWAVGRLATEGSALLKRRLLAGALQLSPEEIRLEGTGQLLSRVLEAEAVESLAVGGGAGAALAVLELLFTLGLFALGAGGMLHVGLLLGWVGFTGWLAWCYWQRRERWTEARISLTHQTSELMQGHRTRLVSETLEQWHKTEDASVARYQEAARQMDEELIRLEAIVPRGWMVLGLLGLTPALLLGETSPALLATSLGGILLARQALQRLVQGLSKLAGAELAWRQAAPMFKAAASTAHGRRPGVTGRGEGQRLLLEARGLSFQHPGRATPVLRDASFSLRRGDRVLLEGPSGSGKSTLVALLAGLRTPDHGLLLVQGLDRATLGLRGWRRHVVAAPQFHENHVLTGTFAFNLMMGQGWPASEEELESARKLCDELGLSPLLERMPGGMLQMVGETGWQLSHGERSRLYIARALLQRAQLVLLDESFAALDPLTLQRVMECVLRRADTLLVIAHR